MYNKYPVIPIDGMDDHCVETYRSIVAELRTALKRKNSRTLIVDCYPGVRYDEIMHGLIEPLNPAQIIFSDGLTLPRDQIEAMIRPNMTDDRVFGTMSYAKLGDYFDATKLYAAREQVKNDCDGLTVVYGVGAALVAEEGLLVYADLCRWEIQLRYRKQMSNWLADNAQEDTLRKFKRGYFWEWRIADRHKKQLYQHMDYFLDTNLQDDPRMICGQAMRIALETVAKRPFRTVPYFDPGVWGGQWMKTVCGLDQKSPNFAWSFDGVPEENALMLSFGGKVVQMPCSNLVFTHPEELLGKRVYARFGAEFPIRFDFLDTMDGQNLSLQVHPRTAFAMDQFGVHYTQDESYYILDAKGSPSVFLGLQSGIDPLDMIADLTEAQQGGKPFPAHKYVNRFPAKKHDHFLIPAGTIHCSGADTMVLEISATPYIFTFKLWDWGRLGLDGLPRPTHIDFGKENIAWERDTEWVRENLVNRVEKLHQDGDTIEERTGLHESEFIETRRHWFSSKVCHRTEGSVNVLNLVEGSQAVVESPSGAFAPFVVNYAETFIIPASVEEYTIAPYGEAVGQTLATIKAYVRT